MRRRPSLMFFLVMAATAALSAFVAQRSARAAEEGHPLVSRFPGSRVVRSAVHEFDEYWMLLGRLVGEGQAEKHQILEGKWTHFTLTNPPSRSVAEISKRYEERLSEAGFQVVYACRDAECGEGGRKTNGDWWPLSHLHRYLAAHLARPEGDVWVSLHVHARNAATPGQHELDILEMPPPAEPPAPERLEQDPAALNRVLREAGHVALYEITFDPGKATVRPESDPVLRAIAEMLTGDPGLKLHVVVHTDNLGNHGTSVELSKRRAAAVVALLTKRYRVASARVRPGGVGPLAPMASNSTEGGRAKNSRVELVRQ